MNNNERGQPPVPCGWLDHEVTCGQPSVTTITVRGRVGSATVPVCDKHKSEHNRKAAELRASRK